MATISSGTWLAVVLLFGLFGVVTAYRSYARSRSDTDAQGQPDPSSPWPPGWHEDPVQSGQWRWWDGRAWTEQVSGVPPPRPWILTSSASLGIERLLATLDAIAVVICVIVVLHALLLDRPIDGFAPLLIVGIPLLAVGQLWIIIATNARRPRPSGSWSQRARWQMDQIALRNSMFGGLTHRGLLAVGTGFILGWLAAMTAVPGITNGNPAAPTPGCSSPLVDHGTITCVSHAAYVHAGASLQRFAVGILMGFFIFHFGGILSEVLRRRPGASSPPPALGA